MPAANTSLAALAPYRKTCPSIFATHAAPKMSDRYAFVSTADLIAPLLGSGYTVTQASQRSTRSNGRDPAFTRHIVRMRAPGAKPIVGDTFPEVVLTNSHDGQSRLQMHAGLFKLLCSNGLVVGLGPNVSTSFVHSGDRARILDGANEAVKLAASVGPLVQEMTKVKLTDKQMKRFAKEAAKIAYEEKEDRFDASLLLAARREGDADSTLWHVFNRVQENVIRGGVAFVSPTSGRTFTTRGITHIGRTTDFNLRLWDLAVDQLRKAA